MILLKTFFTSNNNSIYPTISTFARSSDQVLHCLLTDRSVKMKKIPTIDPINKNEKLYLDYMV